MTRATDTARKRPVDALSGATRETLESEQDEAELRRRVMSPRLVCVMGYERLESGGGPVLSLQGVRHVAMGGGREKVSREGLEATVTFEDPYASRKHARLTIAEDGTVEVEDTGSRNGTTLMGTPITHARVEDGQWFETGRTVWMIRLGPRSGAVETTLGPTRSFSPEIQALADRIGKLAPTQVSILLLGETGTGKEIVARHAHAASGRTGAFVPVNCGALVESLVDSELFGHKRGAFTGATADRRGYVEAADGGTLFLDEVGELPLSAQTRLLRVLQEKEVVPVGGVTASRVDVRVIAATHRDLDRLVSEGRFRADLYARLAGYVARLPRLSQRREDLGELISHAVRTAGRSARCSVAAGRAMLMHDWPLNVRALHKAIEAALVLAEGRAIELDDLPPAVRERTEPGKPAEHDTPLDLDEEDAKLRAELVEVLRTCGGNVSKVASTMGKHRQQIQRWIRRLRIRPDEFGGEPTK